MKIKFIIITYNRDKILLDCINTLYGNTEIKPYETWIIDDGSTKDIQNNLFSLSRQLNDNGIVTNILLSGRNYGIGHSFERAYNLMRQDEESDIVCFIESDYIWRKGWLEDVLAVFEASPNTIAIAGTDHPDMYDKVKTYTEFNKLMVEQFGEDLTQRNDLYNSFKLETKVGNIEVQGVSNSCGCQIIHWRRLKNIFNQNLEKIKESDYWKWMDRAFHKYGTGNRRFASDAHMSGTLSMFSELYMKYKNIDITKNFGFLSISDYSISQHICGGGINGQIVPEGYTFINSPKWNNDYLKVNPRK